jgi:DNA-binding XRE family transcriptional regulator
MRASQKGRSAHIPWSNREINALHAHYPSADWVAIQRAIPNRTRDAILQMGQVHKIKRLKRSKTFWTGPEKERLRKLWPFAPWPEILSAIPRHPKMSIARMASFLGVKRDAARRSPYPIIRELRKIRRERGFRQDILAEQLGSHRIQIAKWERGEQVPRLRTFFDWVQALDLQLTLTTVSPADR